MCVFCMFLEWLEVLHSCSLQNEIWKELNSHQYRNKSSHFIIPWKLFCFFVWLFWLLIFCSKQTFSVLVKKHKINSFPSLQNRLKMSRKLVLAACWDESVTKILFPFGLWLHCWDWKCDVSYSAFCCFPDNSFCRTHQVVFFRSNMNF